MTLLESSFWSPGFPHLEDGSNSDSAVSQDSSMCFNLVKYEMDLDQLFLGLGEEYSDCSYSDSLIRTSAIFPKYLGRLRSEKGMPSSWINEYGVRSSSSLRRWCTKFFGEVAPYVFRCTQRRRDPRNLNVDRPVASKIRLRVALNIQPSFNNTIVGSLMLFNILLSIGHSVPRSTKGTAPNSLCNRVSAISIHHTILNSPYAPRTTPDISKTTKIQV